MSRELVGHEWLGAYGNGPVRLWVRLGPQVRSFYHNDLAQAVAKARHEFTAEIECAKTALWALRGVDTSEKGGAVNETPSEV